MAYGLKASSCHPLNNLIDCAPAVSDVGQPNIPL